MSERSFYSKKLNWLPLVGLLALVAGCADENGEGAEHPEMEQPVLVAVAAGETVTDSLSLLGTLRAKEAVDISSVREGRIEELPIREGSEVRQGDILVGLDARLARAALAQAQAAYNLSQADLKRSRELFEGRTISEQEFDQARSTYEVAEATLQRYQEELADMVMKAPFDGVIGRRYLSIGQYVTAGERIARLVALDPMEVVFNVPERFIGRVGPGSPVNIRIDAYPSEEFAAEVVFLDPEVDALTRTVPVKAELPNPDKLLRDGMLGRLELVMAVREDALVVPEEALIFRGKNHFVMVVDGDDRVEERGIKPGRRLAGRVEVLEGLEPGERVVVEGVQKVWPGSKVIPSLPGGQDDAD